MTYQQAVFLACETLGSQAALAKAIEVAPALVHQWRSGSRPVPVQHCLSIERATGAAVSRRDLRPDDWHLIWPELAPGAEQSPSKAEATHG
ncbi:helix-turn-helix domain-containing protein [Acidovorax sp. SUPP2539]|uniref:transcriptional regulator n=1 Tax=Acidovorax sp. SUPP2539 TaxID=2920878 RepID=UPI0024E0DA2D|nr:helix-turn-helix domain-containing protein [Acidovorax sp. SUPP2539]